MTEQELRERVSYLENMKGIAYKRGIIVYCHDKEAITETFTNLEVGFDTTEIINSRPLTEYVGATISGRNTLFADFDNSNPNKKFGVGDEVEFYVTVGGFKINENKNKSNRPTIYNNVEVVKCKLIKKAGQDAPAPINTGFRAPSTTESNSSVATEDAPF